MEAVDAGPARRARGRAAPAAPDARPLARDADPLHARRGSGGRPVAPGSARRTPRSASWSPTARSGSRSSCGSWPSSTSTARARSISPQAETFGEIDVEWTREPERSSGDRREHDSCGRSRRCSSSPTSRSRPSSSRRRSSSTAEAERALRASSRASLEDARLGGRPPQRRRRWRLTTHPDAAPDRGGVRALLAPRPAHQGGARDARRSSRTSSPSPGTRSRRSAASTRTASCGR